MAQRSWLSWIFGKDYSEDQESRTTSTLENEKSNSEEPTIQDAIGFVAELQSYYYNDICSMQTNLLVQREVTEDREKFINKKVEQEKKALIQIEGIVNLVQESERNYQAEVGRKSIYTFGDEIVQSKIKDLNLKIFGILLRLFEINTKPELDEIIRKRIENYRLAWGIETPIEIPKNYNAILVDEHDGIREYQFGPYCKEVYPSKNEKALSISRLDKIRNMRFEFESDVPTNFVLVHVASVTRLQLNYMKKTSIFDNDWEYDVDIANKLSFDVVKMEDLEQYLKGILQIVLTRKTYAVISMIIPTNHMLSVIGPTRKNGKKVEICKKYKFILRERNGLYGKDLITARIDRRNIPDVLRFVSFLKFRKVNF